MFMDESVFMKIPIAAIAAARNWIRCRGGNPDKRRGAGNRPAALRQLLYPQQQ